MAATVHPAATHHLPAFISAPGETDLLLNVLAIALVAGILSLGVLLLRLHSLPERVAHKSKKLQVDIVALLCLLSLFTHIHAFWVAALLLAFIEFPDFGTPLRTIASALDRIAAVASKGVGTEDRPAAGSAIIAVAADEQPAGPDGRTTVQRDVIAVPETAERGPRDA